MKTQIGVPAARGMHNTFLSIRWLNDCIIISFFVAHDIRAVEGIGKTIAGTLLSQRIEIRKSNRKRQINHGGLFWLRKPMSSRLFEFDPMLVAGHWT